MTTTAGLQIGNWIHPTFPMQIVSIDKDGACADFVGNEGGVWEFAIKDIEPIALTPEILEKAGFFNKHPFYNLGKISILWGRNEVTDNGRTFFNSWSILDHQPEYLHQLQNLVYSLSGTELTITL